MYAIKFMSRFAAPTLAVVLAFFGSTSARAAGCVDFTGSWAGTCNTDGQVTNDSIEIQQSGCEQINLGGLVSVIGSTKTYSGTQGNVVTTVSITTQWNADRTQLPGRLHIEKGYVGQPAAQVQDFYTGMGMNGSQLVIAGKSAQGQVSQCVYSRR